MIIIGMNKLQNIHHKNHKNLWDLVRYLSKYSIKDSYIINIFTLRFHLYRSVFFLGYLELILSFHNILFSILHYKSRIV